MGTWNQWNNVEGLLYPPLPCDKVEGKIAQNVELAKGNMHMENDDDFVSGLYVVC